MNDKLLRVLKCIQRQIVEQMKNVRTLMMKLMVVLDWGEESTSTSLINIVKTSVTIDGENFNIIPSLKQKYYVKMPTNLIPIEYLKKMLNQIWLI
jgi:hypothetical protein